MPVDLVWLRTGPHESVRWGLLALGRLEGKRCAELDKLCWSSLFISVARRRFAELVSAVFDGGEFDVIGNLVDAVGKAEPQI